MLILFPFILCWHLSLGFFHLVIELIFYYVKEKNFNLFDRHIKISIFNIPHSTENSFNINRNLQSERQKLIPINIFCKFGEFEIFCALYQIFKIFWQLRWQKLKTSFIIRCSRKETKKHCNYMWNLMKKIIVALQIIEINKLSLIIFILTYEIKLTHSPFGKWNCYFTLKVMNYCFWLNPLFGDVDKFQK